MEKINFINQSTPALNSTNLNKLQDNVEDAIDEVQTEATAGINTKLDKTSVKTTKTTSNIDTYSCNYLNKNIMSLSLTQNENYQSTDIYQTIIIPITMLNSVGDKLTYSNNKVKIGSGVSKVKINAHSVGVNFSENSTYGIVVKKESSIISEVAISFVYMTDSTAKEFDVSGILCDVNENDNIAMYVYIDQASKNIQVRGSNNYAITYMTVEVVE